MKNIRFYTIAVLFGKLPTRDLHGPSGPAGQAEAGRAHKPTTWNRPGRAFSSNGPGFIYYGRYGQI